MFFNHMQTNNNCLQADVSGLKHSASCNACHLVLLSGSSHARVMRRQSATGLPVRSHSAGACRVDAGLVDHLASGS